MIDVIDLRKSFQGTEVLKGVSLRVEKGEILALIGGSGKGKSVLLKHIVGLLKGDSGTVLIDGEEIARARGKDLERIRSKFGFLFQGGALFDSLSVFDNVAFPLREKTRLRETQIKEKVMHQLELVGLVGGENKYPAELSGGMKKRAAFARSLIIDPEIMLFDEPTTGLDPIITNTIHELIKDIHTRIRFTGIIVSHEIPKVFSVVQKVALLDQGKIVAAEKADEVMATKNAALQNLINESI
ncbi:MAG TPA: ATP-binding cassette domain-containing protein [Thermodesulfobacteriota bacterium]|nr:ATP-binding cassette domain-containing protein [Deltaproteobacteria bacterium]HNR13381.1 ATP-binding cassette domain-containing protein [Thermodesulfobacteriota bacterium]HNU70973.1 ATP-binding cassette domain-containing protein [Thermodesulfobacteriota bacterium]HQO77715.1 ATP-binding cassette domain-containing protein [Thermodesulfobacteriota bacterium]